MISIHRYSLAIIAACSVVSANIYAAIQSLEANIIEEYEGFSSTAYVDGEGRKAIGYGHDIRDHENYHHLTVAESKVILRSDIEEVQDFLNQVVTVPISRGQFSALTSLVYNWGKHHFLQSKGLKDLNHGLYEQASIEFFSKERGVVNINGQFSKGLFRRRQAELELWNDED